MTGHGRADSPPNPPAGHPADRLAGHAGHPDCCENLFPRGLEQPPGSFRFGADALLLAAFAARHAEKNLPRRRLAVADLGCGCGAVLLGLALRCPGIAGLGLDREPFLVEAARRNARALNLHQRLRFTALDMADLPLIGRESHPLHAGRPALHSLDMAVANPPFGIRGRPPSSPLRQKALGQGHHAEDILHVFCRTAALLLRRHGRFFCIHEAAALPLLCRALDATGFGLREILPVSFRSGDAPRRILIMARKHAAHDLKWEKPLVLHGPRRSAASTLSPEALAFCPWLGAGRAPQHTDISENFEENHDLSC